LADIIALSHLLFFKRLGFDYSPYKNLDAYIQNNAKRQSVIDSTPKHWMSSDDSTAMNDCLKLINEGKEENKEEKVEYQKPEKEESKETKEESKEIKLKLYKFNGSPYARRVIMYLKERNIEYEEVDIDLFKGEHKNPEYLHQKNPRGKVPCLQDGNITVYESMAIIHYLEFKYPYSGLYPTDLKERAETETRIQDYNTNSCFSSSFYLPFFGPKEKWDLKSLEPEFEKYDKEMKFLDKLLEHGKYFNGTDVNIILKLEI
jgi:glutathione S-transferase